MYDDKSVSEVACEETAGGSVCQCCGDHVSSPHAVTFESRNSGVSATGKATLTRMWYRGVCCGKCDNSLRALERLMMMTHAVVAVVIIGGLAVTFSMAVLSPDVAVIGPIVSGLVVGAIPSVYVWRRKTKTLMAPKTVKLIRELHERTTGYKARGVDVKRGASAGNGVVDLTGL